MIKRLWTEIEPFDFEGRHVRLTGAFAEPKPVQQPYPPILIAGRTARVLRVVAEHADVWNIAGYSIDEVMTRSALLDRYCTEIARDPATIIRSTNARVDYQDPAATRNAIDAALAADFTHIVLSLSAPYPDNVISWVANQIITPHSTKRTPPLPQRRFCSVARAATASGLPL